MSHPKEAVAFLASKFLVMKFQQGANPVPGSPAVREAVELAHAVLEDVDAYEEIAEAKFLAAQKKAADEKAAAEAAAKGESSGAGAPPPPA